MTEEEYKQYPDATSDVPGCRVLKMHWESMFAMLASERGFRV